MDEPGNDVFSGAALAVIRTEHWRGHFANRERTACMIRSCEDDLSGKLAERLRQRIYRKRRHKSECPLRRLCSSHALKVHLKRQTRGRPERQGFQ